MHIDNPRQLEALKTRYEQIQGALGLQQLVQAQLQEQIKAYLENVAVVAGLELGDGDRVTVDWSTGEVTVEPAHTTLLGQSELVANGVAHDG